MESSVKITLIIALTVILLVAGGISTFLIFKNVNDTSNTVGVDGTSNIKATPDLVSVYFNAQTKGSTSKEANDNNSEMVDEILTALIKQGFERKDIQTESFNIYEDFQWISNKQVSRGYIATHQMKVELSTNEASKIGDVIDAVVDAGATLSYINFELSTIKQNEYKAQALKEASEDATIKAEAIASGLGKKVGKLVSISTSNFNYRPWALYESVNGVADVAMAKQVTTNIQPSEQDVNAQVSAVFKIV
jgi:uncharacterized protein YggE